MSNRMTVSDAMQVIAASAADDYGVLLEHGTLEIGFYAPKEVDPQQPHTQDEVYIIQSGNGVFVNGDHEHPFEAGEALFVPAGVTHRFRDFSDDFAAWVLFYGPDGGEA